MKKSLTRIAAFVAILHLFPSHLAAQMGGPGAPGSMNPAMLKLFGKNSAFTAKGNMRMIDNGNKESLSMVVNTSYLDGKMRQSVDLGEMKSAMMPPQMVDQMKKMGMDKMVIIVRHDKKMSYLVYPGLKSYVEVPMSEEDAATLQNDLKTETKELGKETIDGHPTVKNQVKMTDAKGKEYNTTVWNATDLKNFPIQMEMLENGQKVVLKYQNIQLNRPDAKEFEAPAGFAKYDNVQKLMMEKMMGAAKQ